MANNIYIFTNSYKPILGGIQTVTSQLAEAMIERGLNVIVITNLSRHVRKIYEKISKVPVIRFPFDYSITFLFLCVLFFFRRPKAIYVHFPINQASFILKLKKYFDFNLITCFHGHDVLRYDEGYSKDTQIFKSQRDLVHLSDSITACSFWLARKVEDIFDCKGVKAIYNAVELSRFKEKYPSPFEHKYIFAFGRLEKIKGFDLLINAFNKIQSKNDVYLLIAGEGSQQSDLENLIANLSLEHRCKLIGRKSPHEIVAYAQNSVVNVIPSYRESFGITALEAIASNRPVIATNVGGLPEVVSKSFGLLVDPSIEDLSNGLNNVLKNSDMFDFSYAETYLMHFDIKSMINNYINLMQDNDI